MREGRSLAEFKEQFLKDENGPSGAEDDEGLATEKAENGPRQGCAQETLHHPLTDRGSCQIN